jgi:hypothetical protein
MPRRVITTQYLSTNAGSVDTYFDRVVKYIPADVVAAWVAVGGIVKTMANPTAVLWVAFVVGVILAAAWTWKQTQIPGAATSAPPPTPYKQILIAAAAFVVWAIAIGPPFDKLPHYDPVYGSLLLIGFTLAVGLFDP